MTAIMVNIMDGLLDDGSERDPGKPPASAGRGRRRARGEAPPWTHALFARVTSQHIAVAVTIAGAMAVIVIHVVYAFVIQGWGSPLP